MLGSLQKLLSKFKFGRCSFFNRVGKNMFLSEGNVQNHVFLFRTIKTCSEHVLITDWSYGSKYYIDWLKDILTNHIAILFHTVFNAFY